VYRQWETRKTYSDKIYEPGGHKQDMESFINTWQHLPAHINSSLFSIGTFQLRYYSLMYLVAFAIVYFRFALRGFCFGAIFLTLMLPVEVRIMPTYKVVSDLGMLNSYWGLILPMTVSATAVFLFRQFFKSVPREIAEAAAIDGATSMQFFGRILIPMTRTPIAAMFRYPIYLRLEPVPMAPADNHERKVLYPLNWYK